MGQTPDATGLRGLGDVFLAEDDQQPGESSLPLEPRAVALTAFVVALDTLAVGLALGVVPIRVGPLLGYLAVQAFVAVLLGLTLGQRLGARVGKWATVLGALVFTLYALALVLQAALGGT